MSNKATLMGISMNILELVEPKQPDDQILLLERNERRELLTYHF
jgi:hypothetical protein